MDVITARALLGVSPSAPADTIKRAFRRLAGTSHPDRGGDAGGFGRLVEAHRLALAAAPPAERSHGRAKTSRRWVDTAPARHPELSVVDSPSHYRPRAAGGSKPAGSVESVRPRSVSFGDVLAAKLAAA